MSGEKIFLPFTAPGDRVRAKILAKQGEGRSGAVVEILQPGARAQPVCRHFGDCGGCALQHLSPEAYEAAKLSWLRGALAQQGLKGVEIAPLLRLGAGHAAARALWLWRAARAAAPDCTRAQPPHRRHAGMRGAASRALQTGRTVAALGEGNPAPGPGGRRHGDPGRCRRGDAARSARIAQARGARSAGGFRRGPGYCRLSYRVEAARATRLRCRWRNAAPRAWCWPASRSICPRNLSCKPAPRPT